jgi:hypothetical protein
MAEIILHISDVHFGWEGNDDVELTKRSLCLNGLINCIQNIDSKWKPTVICLTGDIGWKGSSHDYDKAREWIDALLSACGISDENLVLCPGNHDVIREKSSRLPRPHNSTDADKVLRLPLPPYIEDFFSNYINFCKSKKLSVYKIGEHESFLIGSRILRNLKFVCINTAWFSQDNNDLNNLWIGLPLLQSLSADNNLPVVSHEQPSYTTVALAHHSSDWLHQNEVVTYSSRTSPWGYLAQRCHLILTGHTHGTARKGDKVHETAWHFCAGATYDSASYFNSFRLIRIENTTFQYKTYEFDPREADHPWKLNKTSQTFQLGPEATSTSKTSISVKSLSTSELRDAFRSYATHFLTQKSRQLRPSGTLPNITEQLVSVCVTNQHEQFDPKGRIERKNADEKLLPFYEASREARRILLFGDLGAGKSTLASNLAIETIDRSESMLALFIPTRFLDLSDKFTLKDLLDKIDFIIQSEVVPSGNVPKIINILEQQTEVVLIVDGLDELPHNLLAQLLRQLSRFPNEWPTIQVIATARPIEIAGVSYADWKIVHTLPLDSSSKKEILRQELIADNIPHELLEEKLIMTYNVLKENTQLDSLASTPLALRLICKSIDKLATRSDITLGDLLYDLLLEKMGKWNERDIKTSPFSNFERCYPTPESKTEIFSVLSQRKTTDSDPGFAQSKNLIALAMANVPPLEKPRIVEEAINYFKWTGLVESESSLEISLKSLAELLSAIHLLKNWKDEDVDKSTLDIENWRIVSFAASISRRNGTLDKHIKTINLFIKLLITKTKNIPAACYIAVETGSIICAKFTVSVFHKAGFRPLALFGDERITSAHNIAKTLMLAGAIGYKWFYKHYLDPRFPPVSKGQMSLELIFSEWISLSLNSLTLQQKEDLSRIILPYSTTPTHRADRILEILSLILPQHFSIDSQIFCATSLLSNVNFSKLASKTLRELSTTPDNKIKIIESLSNNSLRHKECIVLWAELEPGKRPPVNLLRGAFQCRKNLNNSLSNTAFKVIRDLFDQQTWLNLARWLITDSDTNVSTGAALELYENGITDSSLIGPYLIRALDNTTDSQYVERIFCSLIETEGEVSFQRFTKEAVRRAGMYGISSGCWIIILKCISKMHNGPSFLCQLVPTLGPFTLARFPEVREAFSRLLKSQEGYEYLDILRLLLKDLDLSNRHGAATILVACNFPDDHEALLCTIRAINSHDSSDRHEWYEFVLTIVFTHTTLAFVHSQLSHLTGNAKLYAILLLSANDFSLEQKYISEFIESSTSQNTFYHFHHKTSKELLLSDKAFNYFQSVLGQSDRALSIKAAEFLYKFPYSKLSSTLRAKCDIFRLQSMFNGGLLADVLLKLDTDPVYRSSLSCAVESVHNCPASPLLAQLLLKEDEDRVKWKSIIWYLLFSDDVGASRERDDFAQILFEYGITSKHKQKFIGQGALECLHDIRLSRYRWIDASHWVHVIADEFVGLSKEDIAAALNKGNPITYCATVSLISRLGYLPQDIRYERNMGSAGQSEDNQNILQQDELLDKLKDFSLSSEIFHKELPATLLSFLYYPPVSEKILGELSAIGFPGLLIANILRFCYSRPVNINEMSLVFSKNFLSLINRTPHDHVKNRLFSCYTLIKQQILANKTKKGEYIQQIHSTFWSTNSWKLLVAREILKTQGYLNKEYISSVFNEYINHNTFLHFELFEELFKFSISTNDNFVIEEIKKSVFNSLDILKDKMSDRNFTAFLLFPMLQWYFCGDIQERSDDLFLRGLDMILKDSESMKVFNFYQFLSTLCSLVKQVDPRILYDVISKGLDIDNLGVQFFCRIILSTSEHLAVLNKYSTS